MYYIDVSVYSLEQHPPGDQQLQPTAHKLTDYTIQVLPTQQIIIKSIHDEYDIVKHQLVPYTCTSLQSTYCTMVQSKLQSTQFLHKYTNNINDVITNTIKQFKLVPDTIKQKQARKDAAKLAASPAKSITAITPSSTTSPTIQADIYEIDLSNSDNIDDMLNQLKTQIQKAMKQQPINNNNNNIDTSNNDIHDNNNIDSSSSNPSTIKQSSDIHVERYTIVFDSDMEFDANHDMINKLINEQRLMNNKRKRNTDNVGDDNDDEPATATEEVIDANMIRVP